MLALAQDETTVSGPLQSGNDPKGVSNITPEGRVEKLVVIPVEASNTLKFTVAFAVSAIERLPCQCSPYNLILPEFVIQ